MPICLNVLRPRGARSGQPGVSASRACLSKSRPLSMLTLLALTLLVLPARSYAQEAAELPSPLPTPEARASYGIGRQIGRDLARIGLTDDLLDLEALAKGIRDTQANADSQISQQEFQEAMVEIQNRAQQQMQAKMQALGDKNRRDGPVFLEKYKALKGVQSTDSGLLYKVVKEGTGPMPKATDMVKVHYRGRLVDNSEFDSSYKRDEPAVFPVNGVIPGWTEALMKMKVGSAWQLVIPSDLAYGADGSPPVIGPDAVLIFDVELLGIEEAVDPPQGGQ
jgi:FKBP-type peptidyl-prolyl cis-trans isomerase